MTARAFLGSFLGRPPRRPFRAEDVVFPVSRAPARLTVDAVRADIYLSPAADILQPKPGAPDSSIRLGSR